jgi:ABC-2 type transport system ATP-binding protein
MDGNAVKSHDARGGRADALSSGPGAGRKGRRGLLAKALEASSGAAVEVEGLVKRYGTLTAVNGLSFRAERGRILALLGPNGAGKTSALECVEGIKRPEGGRIRILGMDGTRGGRAAMLAMGIQLQTNGLPPAMTPREAFRFFAGYRGRKPDMAAAERFGLGPKMDAPYMGLSEGQKRRLSLALATAHGPSVLILDEPTAGLDVESRTELHAIIRELKEDGTAVILASHDMAEVEKLADSAIVMLSGKAVASGSPRELRDGSSGTSRLACSSRDGKLVRERPALPGASFEIAEGDKAVYRSADPGRAVTALVAWLGEHGDALAELSVESPSLEERFMEIVRRKS